MIRLLAPTAIALGFAACAPSKPEMQDFWYLDLERGEEVAAQSSRPMLVVFR